MGGKENGVHTGFVAKKSPRWKQIMPDRALRPRGNYESECDILLSRSIKLYTIDLVRIGWKPSRTAI